MQRCKSALIELAMIPITNDFQPILTAIAFTSRIVAVFPPFFFLPLFFFFLLNHLLDQSKHIYLREFLSVSINRIIVDETLGEKSLVKIYCCPHIYYLQNFLFILRLIIHPNNKSYLHPITLITRDGIKFLK